MGWDWGPWCQLHLKRAATRRAGKGKQPSVGRNGLLGPQWDSGRRLYQRSLIMTNLTAFLCPLVRRGHGTPGGHGAHPPQAGCNAASGQRNTACGGAVWSPGRVAALARCARHRASHRAPTQVAISIHHMGEYQSSLVLGVGPASPSCRPIRWPPLRPAEISVVAPLRPRRRTAPGACRSAPGDRTARRSAGRPRQCRPPPRP